MMKRKSRGFLMVAAVVLIAVISFSAILLGYVLISGSKTASFLSQADSSFNIAKGGLEIATRDITQNGVLCYNTNSTPTTLLNGEYSVVGHDNSEDGTLSSAITATATTIPLASVTAASSTLNGAINDTTTTITLASASSFPKRGLVKIDNELIYYSSHTATVLSGVQRGAAGTLAASHNNGVAVTAGFSPKGVVQIDNETIAYSGISGNSLINASRSAGSVAHTSGAAVLQNECILTSTGAVPTVASPKTKTVLQHVLNSIFFKVSNNNYYPRIASVGNVTLSGNLPVNNTSYVCPALVTDPGAGRSVVSAGTITFGASTRTVLNGGGNCSIFGSLKPDIRASETISSLFSSYFGSYSYATVSGAADTTIPLNNTTIAGLLNATTNYGDTIVVNNGVNNQLSVTSNITVGSPTQPVILILNTTNGMIMSANPARTFTVYGLLYIRSGSSATTTLSITRNGSTFIVHGALANEGRISDTNTSTITVDPVSLPFVSDVSIYPNVIYSTTPYEFNIVSR